MFGFGMLRDLFRIPDYVKSANGKPEHEDFQKDYIRLTVTPPVHGSHVIAMMVVGTWYYYCVGGMASFIFDERYIAVAYALGSVAMAIGVWLVGSTGRESCSLRYVMFAVFIVSCACSTLRLAALLPTLPAAVAAAIWTRRWRIDRKERALSFGFSIVILILVGAFAITAGLFAVRWSIDEEIFVKNADGGWSLNQEEAGRRFQSGFEETFGGFGDLSGFNGGGMSVATARKLLEVNAGATDEEITRAFRKMSIKWHPDKYKGDPKEALEMQTKLNEAREVLSKKKKKPTRDVEAEVREERAEAKRAREAKRAERKMEQARERVFRESAGEDGGASGGGSKKKKRSEAGTGRAGKSESKKAESKPKAESKTTGEESKPKAASRSKAESKPKAESKSEAETKPKSEAKTKKAKKKKTKRKDSSGGGFREAYAGFE